jgi:hypothetical protein
MKVPLLIPGARRDSRHPRAGERRHTAGLDGVLPQDAWCESQCRETYAPGTAQQSCLQACWRND